MYRYMCMYMRTQPRTLREAPTTPAKDHPTRHDTLCRQHTPTRDTRNTRHAPTRHAPTRANV